MSRTIHVANIFTEKILIQPRPTLKKHTIMHQRTSHHLLALAFNLGLAFTAAAQVVAYTGGTLTENFDSMGAAGTNTPPGWSVGWNNGLVGGVNTYATNVTINNGATAPGNMAGFNCAPVHSFWGTSNLYKNAESRWHLANESRRQSRTP